MNGHIRCFGKHALIGGSGLVYVVLVPPVSYWSFALTFFWGADLALAKAPPLSQIVEQAIGFIGISVGYLAISSIALSLRLRGTRRLVPTWSVITSAILASLTTFAVIAFSVILRSGGQADDGDLRGLLGHSVSTALPSLVLTIHVAHMIVLGRRRSSGRVRMWAFGLSVAAIVAPSAIVLMFWLPLV